MNIEHAFGRSQLHASTRTASEDQRTIFNGIGNWYVSKTRAVENFELSLWYEGGKDFILSGENPRIDYGAAQPAVRYVTSFGSVRFRLFEQRNELLNFNFGENRFPVADRAISRWWLWLAIPPKTTVIQCYFGRVVSDVLWWLFVLKILRLGSRLTFRDQSSNAGLCTLWYRWSDVYVAFPTVSRWRSRCRIHETCNDGIHCLVNILSLSSHHPHRLHVFLILEYPLYMISDEDDDLLFSTEDLVI